MPRQLSGVLTYADIERRIAEGRGQGEGDEYQPWIRVGEFRNRGESHIVPTPGRRSKREYHCLSQGEVKMLLILEYLKQVIDIREQFPFPLDESIAVAKAAGLVHPNKSRYKTVVTIDMLATVENLDGSRRYVARSIKTKQGVKSKGALKNLQLERAICAQRGWNWELFTDDELSQVVYQNLIELSSWFQQPDRYTLDDPRIPVFVDTLLNTSPYETLDQRLDTVSARLNMEFESAKELFQFVGWHQLIPLDLNVRLSPHLPHIALTNKSYQGPR